jgi:hypothetical protein
MVIQLSQEILLVMVDNNLSWMQEELQQRARTIWSRHLWMMLCQFGMKIYHQFLKMMKRLVEERHGPVWGVQPSIFDGDDTDGDEGGSDDELLPDSITSRRRTVTVDAPDRNVRPRREVPQPEPERGTSLMPSRKESEATSAPASASAPASSATVPRSWPSIHRNLDDLPQQLRDHFARAQAIQPEDHVDARAMFTTFFPNGLKELMKHPARRC